MFNIVLLCSSIKLCRESKIYEDWNIVYAEEVTVCLFVCLDLCLCVWTWVLQRTDNYIDLTMLTSVLFCAILSDTSRR